ncbi:hypothetical protein C0J52_07219, partial [Blattella germanica]
SGVSEGADTSTSGGVITDFITKTPDYAGDSVTTGNATAENGTTSVLKKIIDDYSFLARPVADRLRTHRWFPRLNRIAGIIFSTVMATIAGIAAGAGGTAIGGVLIILTISGAALIITAVVIAIVTLSFLAIFL